MVCPSFGPCVRPSVSPSVRNAFVSAGRDEPANDLFRVYKLVFVLSMDVLFHGKPKTGCKILRFLGKGGLGPKKWPPPQDLTFFQKFFSGVLTHDLGLPD